MINKIKETCICGSILEFTEECRDSLQSHIAYRQANFHRAHQICREKNQPKANKDNKGGHDNG